MYNLSAAHTEVSCCMALNLSGGLKYCLQDAKTANSFERGECDDVEVGTEFCEPSIAALENEMAERVVVAAWHPVGAVWFH